MCTDESRERKGKTCRELGVVILFSLLALSWAHAADTPPPAGASPSVLVGPPASPRPFTSLPAGSPLYILAMFGILGFSRGLLRSSWTQRPCRWLRSLFTHAIRLGWLAFLPALTLDGLIFFMGGRYSHGWALLALTFAWAPFAAGLQWEKSWWNPRTGREEAYPPAFNYYAGIALAAFLPALLTDWVLSRLARADQLTLLAAPLNLLALGGLAGSAAFAVACLARALLRGLLFPQRTVRFFLGASSRFYALIVLLSLSGMALFHYFTLPFFFEILGYTLGPVPAITLDQALIILVPNVITVLCVIYFSIFAGVFVSMLPIILFSRGLRRKPEVPPTLDALLKNPALSREYLGRELTTKEILPTIVTVTAYNEPAEPLEKTLYGYLKLAREWLARGLPRDRYIILFSHQTEREEERLEFEEFLRNHFPGADARHLLDRDWTQFDEDNPSASIRSESKLNEVLLAWLKHKGLDPESKGGRSEYQKRRVCQRLYEFSCHAPHDLFALPDPPHREYGPQKVDSWIWYYLIPKAVAGNSLQVTSKAHNLHYAREAVWGKEETSPLQRNGIFHHAPEWLFDASDADSEIHDSCVAGILASYTPFYKEPNLGWLQRLSYTIEPSATFLSAVKSASEVAYWSWYLRARVHTYRRKGKPLFERVGEVLRPIRRDFQSANGHNMVVRGTSIQAAGGDIEHETATVHEIESPLKRWLARLRGQSVPAEKRQIEKWVPTGEDLELATRMALEGFYGDYAVYAPQGEGSPADFRGNVPQAIRWSGNNVQLMFLHLGRVFTSRKLTFNEKMGYFVNLATLASAPLLYLSILRAALVPFLDIPDVYSSAHKGLGPLALILALAPNFLLLALALSGQLVVKPAEPWQRTVLKPWHRSLLQWLGYAFVPPLSIGAAACLPGWMSAVGVEFPEGLSWGLVLAAININIILLLYQRAAYASLAYCILLLPFLQVLYLAWIIFGIIGTLNMIVKTQIVEPYLSRLAGTFHPPESRRYPSDASGRFLAMNQRFPWLFLPIRWIQDQHRVAAILLGGAAALLLWANPPPGFWREGAAVALFLLVSLWLWRRLPGLLGDWFLDRDCLLNRWWDYWTNPQAAFVKTIKERQERSLSTILKDNVFGILNGLLILALIIHVHFIHSADLSASLLAYLTFSIAASWIISPFFYEEPHRTLRSQGKAFLLFLLLLAAFLTVPLGLSKMLQGLVRFYVIPPVLEPWLEGLLGTLALAGLVNLAPWPPFRAFFKRFALAFVMLGLLFLNGLAVSYRGVSVDPLQDRWANEADQAFQDEVRREAIGRARLEDLEKDVRQAEEAATVSLVKERMAFDWLADLRSRRLSEAGKGLEDSHRKREIASRKVALEAQKQRFQEKLTAWQRDEHLRGAAQAGIDELVAMAQTERSRRRDDYQRSLLELGEKRRRLASLLPESEEAKSQADSLSHFETEVAASLGRDLDQAEDFLSRLELARGDGSLPSRAFFKDLEALPGGDLFAAKKVKERADTELERAAAFLEQVGKEVSDAEGSYEAARRRRQMAWRRRDELKAKYALALKEEPGDGDTGTASAWKHGPKTALLERKLRDQARTAFWTRPDSFDSTQKGYSRFRPLLENNETRKKLADALRWIASKHWVKRLILEGDGWYPRKGCLERLESDLPEAIRRFKEAEVKARVEGGRAEFLMARGILAVVRKILDDPALKKILPDRENRSLQHLRSFPEEDPGPEGSEKDAFLGAFLEAQELLQELHAELKRSSPADAPRELGLLAQAGLESFVNISSLLMHAEGGEPAFLDAGLATILNESQRQALVVAFGHKERMVSSGRLIQLRGWERGVKVATESHRVASLVDLLSLQDSTEPLADTESTRKKDLLLVANPGGILQALSSAVRAVELLEERRLALEEEEDQILAEIDRLEPYLIGQADPVPAEKEAPYPMLLLRRERADLQDSLVKAQAALVDELEKQATEEKRQIDRSLKPRREQLQVELMEDLKSRKASALEGPWKWSWPSVLRCLLASRAQSALEKLGGLFDQDLGKAGESSSGLLEKLSRARTEAEAQRIATERAPGDVVLARQASQKMQAASSLELRSEEAWKILKEDIAQMEDIEPRMEEGTRTQSLAPASSKAHLEELAQKTATSLEEGLPPLEALPEKIALLEEEAGRISSEGLSEEKLRSLFQNPVPRPTFLGGELPEIEEKARGARRKIRELEKDSNESLEGPREPSREEERSADAPQAQPHLGLKEAVELALAHACEPGGPILAAEKETDIALEELQRSTSQFYPEVFGSLGAASNVPVYFQGGGFSLVTFSLDQLKNRQAFEHQGMEKEYLRELAELLTVLKALRAQGSVLAAEIELSELRARVEPLCKELKATQDTPGAEDGAEDWLSLERERLQTLLLLAEEKLKSRRRALNALLGRPLTEEFTLGFEREERNDGQAANDRVHQLDSWLKEARQEIEQRFPKHPAFQATLAAQEKYEAQEEEARLKSGWPVFRAGAGLVGPNVVPFSVGASLIVPLLDRKSELGLETAGAEKRLVKSKEEKTLFLERCRRRVARAEQEEALDQILRERDRLEAHLKSVREAFQDYLHGFTTSASQAAGEVGSFRQALEETGTHLERYILSGLELVETGASLRQAGGEEAKESFSAEAAPSRLAADLSLERERSAMLQAKLEREEQLFERIGVGAGVSYSSLFIPLPGLEMTYGQSAARQEAAKAGLDYQRQMVALVEEEASRSSTESLLDWLRDAKVEGILERQVALRQAYLETALRLSEEGIEPPLTVESSRRRLAEMERELASARLQTKTSAALYQSLLGNALPQVSPLTREWIEREIAPGSPALRGLEKDALQKVKALEAEYRFRLLIQAIENKKPYGGSVGNFLAPLWDLVRLWRRPGSPEEIAAQLREFRQLALQPQPRTSSGEAQREFQNAIEKLKSVLGGDGYELSVVGKALGDWFRAEAEVQALGEEIAGMRSVARSEYLASQRELEWAERHHQKLREDLARGAAPSPQGTGLLRLLALEDEQLKADASEGRALWRYARARATQMYLREPVEAVPQAPAQRRQEVTLSGLVALYAAQDAETAAVRAALGARRRELEFSRGSIPLDASLPAVLPALAVDPRFGGSGLTTSMSAGSQLDPYRQTSEIEHEILALEAELTSREVKAGLKAVDDALKARLARERLTLLENELRAREGELASVSARREAHEASPSEVTAAASAVKDALRSLEEARDELEGIERRIDARAGRSVGLVLKLLREEGEPTRLGNEVREAWTELAREKSPMARAASERSQGSNESSTWSRLENWLSTRLELVGSLGQTAKNLGPGGGGFFAVPIQRLVGLVGENRARIDQIRAEELEGEKERLGREEGEALEDLTYKLKSFEEVLAARERELEIAESSYELERLSQGAEEHPVSSLRSASQQFLESVGSYWKARTLHDAAEEELNRRLLAYGAQKPVSIERPPQPAPRVRRDLAPSRLQALAEEMVEEWTELPEGPAFEVAMIDARLEWIQDEISQVHDAEKKDLSFHVRREMALDPDLEAKGTEAELRAALLRALAQKRADLEWEKGLLLESKQVSRLPLSLEDLRLPLLLASANVPSAKAEEIENCFQALGRLLSAVRRAKYADAIARSELGHQGEQRDKVRQIDVHGQFRQAKSQAERLLETMETASRKLVLSFEREFRQQELALLEGRIKASGSRQGQPRKEPVWSEVVSYFQANIPRSARLELDRLLKLRLALERLLELEADGSRKARWERETLQRNLARSRALKAARRAAEVKGRLELAANEFFSRPEVKTLVPQALKVAAKALWAQARSKIQALQAELDRLRSEEPAHKGLTLEKALEVLRKVAHDKAPQEELDPASSAEAALQRLRRISALWQMAREKRGEATAGNLVSGPPEVQVSLTRDLLQRQKEFFKAASVLKKEWSSLLKRVDAVQLPSIDGAVSLGEEWRRELAREDGSAPGEGEKLAGYFARTLPVAADRLLQAGPEERARAAELLRRELSSPLHGSEALEKILPQAESAAQLSRFASEVQALFESPFPEVGDLRRAVKETSLVDAAHALGLQLDSLNKALSGNDSQPLELSIPIPSLEALLRKAAVTLGLGRAELLTFLGSSAKARPSRILRWLEALELKSVPLSSRLSALREASARTSQGEARARTKGLSLNEAKNELRSTTAWYKADREAERVHLAIYHDLKPLAHGELLRKGYADARGKLLNLPDLVARDQQRILSSIENLVDVEGAGLFRQPVDMGELLSFLDHQLQVHFTSVPEEASGLTGGKLSPDPSRIAFSTTYAGLDMSYTSSQALHALAELLLYPRWDREGLDKAEMLLLPYALYRNNASLTSAGFQGLPKMFLASSGEVGDEAIEAAPNALTALAAQLHAAVSGTPKFLDLARDIIDRVLLAREKSAREESSSQDGKVRAPRDLSALSLLIAALRNQAALERVLEDPIGRRYSDEAARLTAEIFKYWHERAGVFEARRGAPNAGAHLTCLAVLSQDPRLTSGSIRKAVRSLDLSFGVRDSNPEDYLSPPPASSKRPFQGTWFVSGPVDAYNRFVTTILESVDLPRPNELTTFDAWIFLNESLHRCSGGRLGFTVKVKGFAPDARKERVDFVSTAQAIWVLSLLGRKLDDTPYEESAEEIDSLARAYAREIGDCAVTDPQVPLGRSWRLHLSGEEMDHARGANLQGRLYTDPACYWIFARFARQGAHPFFVRDLEKLRDSMEANARGPLQGRASEKLEAPPGQEGEKPAPSPLVRPLPWLEKSIGERGLIRAMEDPAHPYACRTYPAALAITHFALAGARGTGARYLEEGKALWNAMQRLRGPDGAWLDAYDMRSGAVYPGPRNRATGPNSWMALAGIHLSEASQSPEILEQARETLDWVLSFQDLDPAHESFGAITLGEVSYPNAISTEANADALAAAWGFWVASGKKEDHQRYAEAARQIGRWLRKSQWLGDHFGSGSSRPNGRVEMRNEWLDSQTWTLLALEGAREADGSDPKRYNGLPWLDEKLTHVPYKGSVLHGFAKVSAGPDAFWPEGVAGFVLAQRLIGGRGPACASCGLPGDLLGSLEKARFPDGSLPYIVGQARAREWDFNLRVPSVDGTVWASWADPEVDFNPFRAGLQPEKK